MLLALGSSCGYLEPAGLEQLFLTPTGPEPGTPYPLLGPDVTGFEHVVVPFVDSAQLLISGFQSHHEHFWHEAALDGGGHKLSANVGSELVQ